MMTQNEIQTYRERAERFAFTSDDARAVLDELERTRKSLFERTNETNEYAKSARDAREMRDHAKLILDEKREALASAERELNDIRISRNRWLEELRTAERERDLLASQHAAMTADRNTCMHEGNELRQTVGALRGQLEEAKRHTSYAEIEAIRDRARVAEARVAELERSRELALSGVRGERDALRKKLEETEGRALTLAGKCDDLTARIRGMQTALDQSADVITAKSRRIGELENALGHAKRGNEDQSQRASHLARELAVAKVAFADAIIAASKAVRP